MTNNFQYACLIVYLFALVSLFIYGMNCYLLMIFYRLNYRKAVDRHKEVKKKFNQRISVEDWPRVTIQLPLFNERYVVERLINSMCRLDYPKRLLEIQVLDDSTDETADIARAMVAKMQSKGFDIAHYHRRYRKGYKAGALKEGLDIARGALIAIFDADFVPNPDFLKESVPYFLDPQVGLLQTRWGHINGDYSPLTRAQSMGIDGHFGVEQTSRAWSGLFLNFNGTAGVWRKKAIVDAGGWQADTLTEDLDLSYRAQLRGWKLCFAPNVVCPAEIPVTINAFKSQQHRWAKGSIQTAKKNLGKLFRAEIPLLVKIQAFLHLTHYIIHPMMLVVVVTSLPMLYSQRFFDHLGVPLMAFTLLCLATFGPSTMYLFSQRILYKDWKNRIKYLPFLMCLGTGIAVNNTKAVLEAILNIESGFIRTPKYGIKKRGDQWRNMKYSIPINPVSVIEFFLGVYSLVGLIMFIFFCKYLVSPFLLIYTSGFFYVFVLSVKHGTSRYRH
jgi:cellulose synthase/poly-beta-1,6-N-acetylglucosamine synthase-like glycosyltransferase